MKYHILFSGKNKKIIAVCCLLKFLPSMLSVYVIQHGFTGIILAQNLHVSSGDVKNS